MVRKLPLPLHERIASLGPCIHYLEDRVRCRIPEDVGQARSVPSWFPLYRHADKGASMSSLLRSCIYLISVKASSDKIIREMEMFGPEFQNFTPEDVDDAPVPSANVKNADTPVPAVDKAKKGKLMAKSTGLKYQFQIMESIGIPRSEIKKFADPLYWLEYFPPIAMVRLFFKFEI